MSIKKHFTRILAIRTAKGRTKNAVLDKHAILTPGFYWIKPSLAVRLGGESPTSLRLTKDGGGNTGSRRFLYNAISAILPPFFVVLRGGATQPYRKGVSGTVLLTAANDVLKVFDVDSQVVYTYAEPSVTERILAVHQSLKSFLPVNDVTSMDDSLIFEPLIEGVPIRFLPTNEQRRVFEALLDYSISKLEIGYSFHALGYKVVENFMRKVKQLIGGHELWDRIEGRRDLILEVLAISHSTTVHGDLNTTNVLDAPLGPIVIDFDGGASLPIWYDFAYLLFNAFTNSSNPPSCPS